MTRNASLRDAIGPVALAAAGAALIAPAVLAAQAPPANTADTARLAGALRTLATDPQSFDALVDAGEASLKLGDEDAALGFFRRADALQPHSARVMGGLGSVMVRQRQPLEALRLFREAEQGGSLAPDYVADRGLAYDLIGDNARAQQDYQLALAARTDPTVTRRLALSLAIAGDQRASDATLLPLLQRQDLAAYRTRAFALAILGKGQEAVSIAETMLPDTLSDRMAPYLRYMPRLTRAQQAAAANLGAFPSAGDIGRDDPAVVAYAASIGGPRSAGAADARLVPSGAPMGSQTVPAGPVRVASASQEVPAGATRVAIPAPAIAAVKIPVARAGAATPADGPVRASAAPAPSLSVGPASRPAVPERARAMIEQHPAMADALVPRSSAEAPVAGPGLGRAALPQEATITAPGPSAPAAAAPLPEPPQLAAAVEPAPQPVVVATLDAARQPAVVSQPDPAGQGAGTAPVSAPVQPVPRAVSLSEAFADLRETPGPMPVTAPATAVDITRIEPRREQAATAKPAAPTKPAAPPKPPPMPSRQWVQVATGRDIKALGFDWKRIKREAGGLLDKQSPSTADWGQTNRLVVGPFATSGAADQLVGKLKDKKIDAFRFTSESGEAVTPLK